MFSKRLFGRGSVMAWRAFSASGKADLVAMEGKQNSARYINVLEKSIFLFMNHQDTSNIFFHRYNTAIHTSKFTKDWFETKKILIFFNGPLSL